jgi:nucleotide-binding universal stress UspA family protein
MKTVIAAVDFSSVTNRIADEAIKLARLLKGRVVFLHVVPPPLAIRNILPAIEDVKLRTKSEGREADEKLAALKHAFQRKFPKIDLVRITGAPVTSIAEQARELGVEYIVIGSHGHTAVYDIVMGSVASGVVTKAPCPVLIVPPVSAVAELNPQSAREPATARN